MADIDVEETMSSIENHVREIFASRGFRGGAAEPAIRDVTKLMGQMLTLEDQDMEKEETPNPSDIAEAIQKVLSPFGMVYNDLLASGGPVARSEEFDFARTKLSECLAAHYREDELGDGDFWVSDEQVQEPELLLFIWRQEVLGKDLMDHLLPAMRTIGGPWKILVQLDDERARERRWVARISATGVEPA